MKSKKLVVYFDLIMKSEKDKVLVIKGWRADLETKNVPLISVQKSQNILEIKEKNIFCGNVNSAYNIPVEFECGFILLLKMRDVKKGKVRLKFVTETQKKSVTLNLNKRYCHFVEKGNPMQIPYLILEKASKYIKKRGIKNTFKILVKRYTNQKILYQRWIKDIESQVWKNKIEILDEIKRFVYQPKISILTPVYNVDEKWLVKCIESVENQYYKNWELCIADDCSTNPRIKLILESYAKKDKRIKIIYRKSNGHISEASNSALTLATGDYVGLLDNDDELSDKALYEVAKLLNKNPDIDLIYSDEDKIDDKGRRKNPYFKSDWSPDSIMSGNYVCHFSVFKKAILDEIGGFRKGFEGAQDYDLVLRVSEKTKKIYHIPFILYHWRMSKDSTAMDAKSKGYAFVAGRNALVDALRRRKLEGKIVEGAFPGLYNAEYNIMKKELVSIIIPTKDRVKDLKKCVDSIMSKTDYECFEIIVADNGSHEKETLVFFQEYQMKYPLIFKVVKVDIPFNYSEINNIAVQKAEGEFVVFLNNDTEVISGNWLRRMLSFAQLNHVGAVGAKLYYPDDTIQHAGVVAGIGGVAGHVHYHFPKEDNGYYGKLKSVTNYLAVTAACLMIRKSTFENVGRFDEEFAVAFNDVDLCIRIYEAGYYNVWLHDVELYHFESKSRGYEDTAAKKKRFTKEIDLLRERWLKYIENDPFYNPNLTKQHSDFSINLENSFKDKK